MCRSEKSNKILILANNDGGLYQFRRELIQELINKGYDVTISLPNGELVAPFVEMGCRFIDTRIDRRGINPKTDFALFKTYKKILSNENPNLVITYTIKPNVYGGLACRLKRKAYAVNITGLGTAFQKQGILRKLVVFLYKIALKKAKVVFFENSENLKIFVREKIIKPEQAFLLNGAGVNLKHYSVLPYPKSTDKIHFLFIGRIMREKGVEELFEAMQRLYADGENCMLDVVGRYEEDYEEKIKTFCDEGWLSYYGYQSDVRPFIEAAHCFVLPSWHEGMANTNLECAASGRPIITSNIAGCREAVVENKSGFLCESKNPESLYNSMKAFLDLSNEQRELMGKAGRLHMESVFAKEKVVAETLKGLEL